MAVIIQGIRLFDLNAYDKIVIVEREDYYLIKVNEHQRPLGQDLYTLSFACSTNGNRKNNSDLSFNSINHGKTDEEKIISAVKKFLVYATIDTLTSKKVSYRSRYSVAKGSRQLDIRLFNPKLNVVKQMIRKKYMEDRLRFCANNIEIKNIIINLKRQSSYRLTEDTISFDLFKSTSGIADLENQFFESFISDRLSEIGKPAVLEYMHTYFSVQGRKTMIGYMTLSCGDLKVEIAANTELLQLTKEIVNKHNQELKEHKIIQLKMEGF